MEKSNVAKVTVAFGQGRKALGYVWPRMAEGLIEDWHEYAGLRACKSARYTAFWAKVRNSPLQQGYL